jgi:polyphosphate kinase 2 (PPK2 family)
LAVRVHPELLAKEKLPDKLVTKDIWQERFEDINAFERYLFGNGIVVLKFFLHLSKQEQKRRFLDRLDDTEKNWKFSMSDALERHHWEKYMQAYEDMIRNTSTQHAPWYIVPADHKWFTRLVVAEATIGAMESLDLSFPKMDAQRRKELKDARAALEHEG